MILAIDRDRLVEWASRAIGTPSFTGSEEAMAELMRDTFLELGLQVQWQQVEDGRANVLGNTRGRGRGSEPHVQRAHGHVVLGSRALARARAGLSADAFVEDGRLYGLGISNMKGALACYVEAVRALADAGVRLRGDVMIAAVSGEIEKTQWGDAQGAEYRGYAAGSRYLVSHGGVADMCILGEPTEWKVVLGHFGSLWLRISTQGNSSTGVQRGAPRPELDRPHARGARRGDGRIPTGGRPVERLSRRESDRQRRCDRGRLRLARLAHSPPHRPLPRRPRAADEGDGDGPRSQVLDLVAGPPSASPITGSKARST